MPRAKAASDPVVGRIVGPRRDIHSEIVGGRKPSMDLPLPSLSGVRCNPRKVCGEQPGRQPNERTPPAKLKHNVLP